LARFCPHALCPELAGLGLRLSRVHIYRVIRVFVLGRKKGEGNGKNGNKYLAWAFVEAANFALRYCPQAKRFYERRKRKTNVVVALKALAHKLARPASTSSANRSRST
jgi:hypothetical protein